ncbi:hypothetical protein MTE01_31730 [Microbacterium testaceum]|uniref:Uncharacterized protein n=1 Tax=Microbacterium testaceum TaxID=2033 RepID=A0A4Y3QS36_MICTE|nr:hypothetical protein MTE01_31730 [Microbacterium testaceum]
MFSAEESVSAFSCCTPSQAKTAVHTATTATCVATCTTSMRVANRIRTSRLDSRARNAQNTRYAHNRPQCEQERAGVPGARSVTGSSARVAPVTTKESR